MFKLGNKVTWTSSASGTTKTKIGTIACVVSAGFVPSDYSYNALCKRSGGHRDHESYIVIDDAGKEYWPVASKLQLEGNAPTAPVNAAASKKSKSKAAPVQEKQTTRVGFSLDFSGSMSHIRGSACDDYNTSVAELQLQSKLLDQNTYITVMQCGISEFRNEFLFKDTKSSNVQSMPYNQYKTNGNTPLWDSIAELISSIEISKAKTDAALIMVITDGEDNASRRNSASSIGAKIRELQATDMWTFVFRVPHGYKKGLVNLGIHEANIIEWETSKKGMEKSTAYTSNALGSYMTARSAGVTSTQAFYANLNATDNTIKGTLQDISGDLRILPVTTDTVIKDFIEHHGSNFSKGAAFYQLTKTEPVVQDYKQILVQDRRDGKIYGGRDSRDLLNLPHTGNIKLKPGQTGNYDVFIQSTSINRKLISGTKCLYKSH